MANLVKLYKSKEVQRLARQTASTDKHRQRLLRRYTRIQSALNGTNGPTLPLLPGFAVPALPCLAPLRQYRLSIIAHRLERNSIRHVYRAARRTLKALTHQNTLKAAYALLGHKRRPTL